VINLSKIDADTDGTAGNQGFKWISETSLAASFTGVDGQLRFASGLLQGDTDGDKKADFEIRVFGKLDADSIIL
jgi:hypothetical protein